HKDVVSGASAQHIVGVVADELVVSSAGREVFYDGVAGNGQIVRHAVGGRKRTRCKVYVAVRAPPAEVQRIYAAGVVQREDGCFVYAEIIEQRGCAFHRG